MKVDVLKSFLILNKKPMEGGKRKVLSASRHCLGLQQPLQDKLAYCDGGVERWKEFRTLRMSFN
jgi:hypothetical protein